MPRESLSRDWDRTMEEDEYFYKLDAELIDKMRRRSVLEDERRLLAEASGINDREILEDLAKLGYKRETMILLHLVPLVQVAWSSGSVTRRERERVFEVARIRGVKEGTAAHQQLSDWLNERPPEAFFKRSLRAIRMVLQMLPPAERKARKDDLIQYCSRIASASCGLLGFGRRICAAESDLLTQIAAELEKDHEFAARQFVEEARTTPAPPRLSVQFFKNILLVVPGEGDSEGALQRAVALARKNQALLTIAGTYRPSPRDAHWIVASAGGDMGLEEVVSQAIEERIGNLAAAAAKASITVEHKLLRGVPFLEVIREVLRSNYDLVIVAEGAGEPKKKSTTTLKLLRNCPCPVWVMQGEEQGRYAKILAAVDLDPSDEDSVALTHKIMGLAVSLARMEGSELHVIHTWTIYGKSSFAGGLGTTEGTKDRLIGDNERVRQQWLTDLLQQYRLDDLKHQAHLLQGEAGALIPKIAENLAIDLIVMGTVGRPIPGLIMGNTAEKILGQVDCSVLAVKPDGFLTPVMREAA